MASIQRIVSSLTGEVSYRAQVRVKGHAPQGKSFPNKKEANDWRHPSKRPFARIDISLTRRHHELCSLR